MKYLENIDLENLTRLYLTGKELGGTQVLSGRCEVFSTKKAGDDKKQSKVLEQKLEENNPIIPGDSTISKSTKKLFVDLIQTLNASLVDYDFTDAKPESFIQLDNCSDVVHIVNSHLAELTAENPSFLTDMWHSIADAIGGLVKCEAFQLVDDPFADEMITAWSFHFFLYNKELKRICYFSCTASPKCHIYKDLYGSNDINNDTDDDQDDEENNMKINSDSEEGDDENIDLSQNNW